MTFDSDALVKLLKDVGGPVSTKQMMAVLNLSTGDRADLRHELKLLERRGIVQRLRGTSWQIAPERKHARVLAGRLSVNRRGLAFVRLDADSRERSGGTGDVFVVNYDMSDALDGDDVIVELLRSTPQGLRGIIIEVTRRAHEMVVGHFQRTGEDRGEVIPRNTSLQRRISVPLPDPDLGVSNFEWVVARVTDFTSGAEPLRGTVTERLGTSHEKGIDVLILLRDKGIIPEFPEAVEQAAQSLSVNWDEETTRRRDLRGLETATIDPATAKDFDDALSIEDMADGGWRLWVHIADVSHFVQPGSVIDDEGRERSTSVYPVDRVVPMLPERLSNDLCSLRPLEDKLAMTAEMEVSPNGEIRKSRIYSSIINSNQRLAYEQAQAFFDQHVGAADVVVPELRDKLLMLRDCARALRKRRFERGALDLDIPELEVVFHENGEVSHLHYANRFEAHKLVEDCMLAANEAVATYLTQKQAPLLYRIHEQADSERLQQLAPMLKALDVPLKVSKKGTIHQKDLQAALQSIEGRPAGHIIRRIVLRALKRAQYSEKNAGHFGLASPCYCHFTSPIRRYPDLVVHRQLRALERGEELHYPNDVKGLQALASLAKHTSAKEREADDAEWESSGIKSIEYLKQFEGDEFDGLIASVQPFGLFVELQPHGIEGLVPVRTMQDDRYDLDEIGIALVGQRHGRAYRLTDQVKVRLIRANPFENQLDLELVESGRERRLTGGKRNQRKFYDRAPRNGRKKQRGRRR